MAGGGLLSVGGGQQLQPTNYTRVCMGRGRCVCMGGVCDIPHRIGEKVPNAIYVEAPLNQVDVFRSEERRVGKECRSRWSPYH